MTALTTMVELPDGISRREFLKAQKKLIKKMALKNKRADFINRVLECDSAFNEFRKECDRVPIVRASCYPPENFSSSPTHRKIADCRKPSYLNTDYYTALVLSNISFKHEMPEYPDSEDPRRPIVQKAARCALYDKYAISNCITSPNGWHTRVFHRYLRRIKFTSFSRRIDGGNEILGKLQNRLFSINYGYADRHYPQSVGRWSCWLNGKWLPYLTEHQFSYMQKLHRITQKLETLERKRTNVRLP